LDSSVRRYTRFSLFRFQATTLLCPYLVFYLNLKQLLSLSHVILLSLSQNPVR
jgi:hypothetical protein